MWDPQTVSHHLTIFCGPWSITSGDVRYLIFHVTSKDLAIEGPCNFMSSSLYVTVLLGLVAISIETV